MGAHSDKQKRFEKLRQQAEEMIQQQPGVASQSQVNVLELIHELKIYQAELELQNEELQGAQQVLSDLHEEYQDLYEFAPCGYLTLTPQGMISRANLPAVRLLETERRFLKNAGFTSFVRNGMADRFFDARKNALDSGEKQSVQLAMKSGQDAPRWVRAEIVADRDSNGNLFQFRLVLIDISERVQAEQEVRRLNQTLEQQVQRRTAEIYQRNRQLQQLARALTEAEDQERRRIASVLHDDFQQELAYIKLELGMVQRQCTDENLGPRLGKMIQKLDEAIQKSRDLSYALHPPNLNDLGLEGALAELCREMKGQYGLQVELRVGPDAEPSSRTLAVVLYRSARELLCNVVKHAGSNWAVLELVNNHGMIQLRVEDCGHGFDYDRVDFGEDRRTGFGLYSIEERISSLGGSVTVDSEPGSGCSVLLTVPQPPSANDAVAGK